MDVRSGAINIQFKGITKETRALFFFADSVVFSLRVASETFTNGEKVLENYIRSRINFSLS